MKTEHENAINRLEFEWKDLFTRADCAGIHEEDHVSEWLKKAADCIHAAEHDPEGESNPEVRNKIIEEAEQYLGSAANRLDDMGVPHTF